MEKQLIPVDSQFEELKKLQQEKFEEALRNLITGTTPKDVVYSRKARGGKEVDYIPGWWVVGQLNALFGYNWDLEVVDKGIEWKVKQVWVLVKLIVKGSDGMTVSKTAFGSSDIKYFKEQSDQPLDIADDLKSAVTDGLKKAASMLGIAADIYGERERSEKSGVTTKSQLDALYKVGEKQGMTREQVDTFFDKETEGKSPTEVEQVVILGLIQKLRQRKE